VRRIFSSWWARSRGFDALGFVITVWGMSDERARMTLVIEGIVQGVFFRASTLEQAQSLSLTGWVKNLPDGSVEVTAEGSRYALEDLLAWCRRGPPGSRVDDVTVRWSPCQDEFRTFMVVR
jgi:acylphosphatase